MAQNGPGTPIGFALQAREKARLGMAGVSTPGNPRGPKPKPAPAPTPAPTGKLSRGERNNNPGNLEDGKFTRSQPGYKGSDGRFAIFATPRDGENAQVALLQKNYANMSVAQIIQKYAPLGDNSEASVRNYIGYVASRAGVDPDAKLGDGHYHQVAAAMRAFETGKTGQVKYKGYAGQLRGATRASAGSGGPVPQISVPGSRVPGPSGGMNSGVDNQSGRIMNSGPEMERKQQAVESKVANAGAMLDNYLGVLQQGQQAQITEAQKFVDNARGINQQMSNATQDLQRRVQPIFAARQRVLDQAAEIQKMSPIARAIRGFFDLNYNEDYLMSTSSKLGAIVKEHADIYSVMQGLHGDALEQSNQLMQINTMMPKLQTEQASELVRGAEMSLSHATTDLQATMNGVQNEVQLISAQNAARNDILSRIDGPTAVKLLGQAEQTGGVVNFNGVELSAQELRERGMQIEQYDITNENARMALAAGRADLHDKNAMRMLEYMTDAQIENAIQAGGVIDDVQLPAGALTEEKTRRVKRAIDNAEASEFVATPAAAAKEAMASAQMNETMMRRADSIFGPGSIADESIAFSNRIVELSTRLREMTAAGASPAELGVVRSQLQSARSDFQKNVQAKVTRLVGNDQEGAAFVTSYLMGDRPTPGAAADMMVHFASRGGLPAAMESSALGQNAMTQVMKTIQDVQNEVGPNGRARFANPAAAAKEAARRLANPNSPEGAALRSATTGLRYQSMFSSLPSLARNKDNVATHPFGKIKISAFAQASRRADSEGYAEIATELGISANELVQLQQGRQVPGIDPEVAKRATSSSTTARIAAAQQRHLVTQLDQMPRVSDQMSNSSLMLDFLSSPQAQSKLIAVESLTDHGGIGDWMAGSVSRGGMLSEFSGYTEGFRAAVDETEGEIRSQSARLARGYRNDVPRRTAAILQTIPGMTRGDVVSLVSAIGPMLPKGTPQEQEGLKVGIAADKQNRALGNEGYRTDLARMQIQAVDNIILNHKFEDPNLERIRRRAQGEWLSASRAADNMIDALIRPLDRD